MSQATPAEICHLQVTPIVKRSEGSNRILYSAATICMAYARLCAYLQHATLKLQRWFWLC